VSLFESVGRPSQVVPRSFATIEANLTEQLASIRCPEHDLAAVAQLFVDAQGAMQIIPLGCCDELEQRVFAALRKADTIAPPPLPELELETAHPFAEGSGT
jgi:hypothetical protein